MKTSFLIFLIFFLSPIYTQEDIDSILKYHKSHTIKKSVKKSRCANYYGQELTACLKGACDNKQFKKDLMLLNIEQKNQYIKYMKTKSEFENLFNMLSEEKYQKFVDSLPIELQTKLPKNKKEQKEFLENLDKVSWSETAYYVGEKVVYIGMGAAIATAVIMRPDIAIVAAIMKKVSSQDEAGKRTQ